VRVGQMLSRHGSAAAAAAAAAAGTHHLIFIIISDIARHGVVYCRLYRRPSH